MEYQAEASTDL